MESEADSSDLRVASFSLYLNSAEENFVHKHEVSVQNLSPTSIVFPLSEETPAMTNSGKITSSGETGVFGIGKHHNISIDGDADGKSTALNYKKENHIVRCCIGFKSRLGTPSFSSKASMSSKTEFLIKTAGRKQNNVNSKNFFSGFSCKNICVDRKSICVGENTKGGGKNHEHVKKENLKMEDSIVMDDREENKAKFQVKDEFDSQDSRKVGIETNKTGGHFTVPAQNQGLQNVSFGAKHDGFTRNEEEDSARTSLEVFGSHVSKSADEVAMNLGRKLSMLTWDAIPRSQSLPTSCRSRVMNDDLGSDASSDLFEIENLLGTGNVTPFLARQASDGGLPQYEASERSIEWSVVTASATDFPAVSDRDEKDVSENVKIALEPTNDTSRRQQGGTGLLGSKNKKPVDVAETVHRISTNPKIPRPHLRLDVPTINHSHNV